MNVSPLLFVCVNSCYHGGKSQNSQKLEFTGTLEDQGLHFDVKIHHKMDESVENLVKKIFAISEDPIKELKLTQFFYDKPYLSSPEIKEKFEQTHISIKLCNVGVNLLGRGWEEPDFILVESDLRSCNEQYENFKSGFKLLKRVIETGNYLDLKKILNDFNSFTGDQKKCFIEEWSLIEERLNSPIYICHDKTKHFQARLDGFYKEFSNYLVRAEKYVNEHLRINALSPIFDVQLNCNFEREDDFDFYKSSLKNILAAALSYVEATIDEVSKLTTQVEIKVMSPLLKKKIKHHISLLNDRMDKLETVIAKNNLLKKDLENSSQLFNLVCLNSSQLAQMKFSIKQEVNKLTQLLPPPKLRVKTADPHQENRSSPAAAAAPPPLLRSRTDPGLVLPPVRPVSQYKSKSN